jgi:hypothetical protein
LVLHILDHVFVSGVFLLLRVEHIALTYPSAHGHNKQCHCKSEDHENREWDGKCANTSMAHEMQIGT